MTDLRVAVVPGDGIGIEVIAEATQALTAVAEAAGKTIHLTPFDWGAEHYLRTGDHASPGRRPHAAGDFDAILLGAMGDPRVPDNRHAADILLGLRFALDLYVNYRPVRLLHERLCPLKGARPGDVDFVVFRENTEGPYVMMGGHFKKGTAGRGRDRDRPQHPQGRGADRAPRLRVRAGATGRHEVVMADKSNVLIHAHELWQRVFKSVAAEYPGIEARHLYVDNLALQLVRDPAQFQVIVTSNMFGDIVTDLAAGLQGGLGMAASGNIHPGRLSLFEPVHGQLAAARGQERRQPDGRHPHRGPDARAPRLDGGGGPRRGRGDAGPWRTSMTTADIGGASARARWATPSGRGSGLRPPSPSEDEHSRESDTGSMAEDRLVALDARQAGPVPDQGPRADPPPARGELDLQMEDLRVDDLLDDINTDAMTPAWVCFDYRPEDIARNAYAGLIVERRAAVPRGRALRRQLRGDRLRATQGRRLARARPRCRRRSGRASGSRSPRRSRRSTRATTSTRACSWATTRMLARLQARRGDPARRVHARLRPDHAARSSSTAACSRSPRRSRAARSSCPRRHTAARPMTMAEKILAAPRGRAPRAPCSSSPATRSACASTAATRTSSPPRRSTTSSSRSTAPTTALAEPGEVRGLRGPPDLRDGVPTMAPFSPKIEILRDLQRAFQKHTGVQRLLGAGRRLARHLPQVAREQFIEPGDFIQATDSHTCMGGAIGALAWGVGATEYAALVHAGLHLRRGARVDPLRARRARCAPGVTAKDVMLHILATPRQAAGDARPRDGVRRPGPRVAVARRARDARQHGDRVLGQGRRRRGATRPRSRGSPRAARASTLDALRAQGRRARSRRRLRRRRPRHRPRDDPADGRDARRSRPRHPVRSRRTAPTSTRSATCASTSPTAARAPRARKTTSTCTRA